MRITVTSVMVSNQAKALDFYTRVLGFELKRDIPISDDRWLTIVSKEHPDGVELLLEPMGFEPARIYQKALYDAGIPLTMFGVDNVQQEYDRLKKLGVEFSMPPTQMGTTMLTVLDDTCGNRIQLVQML